MAHKKTPKLLTKLAIVSAVTATLPLTIGTNIHADGIGIQQAMTTTVQQAAGRTNNLAKKNNKSSYQTPEPKADSGIQICYGNGYGNDVVMENGKVTPYGHFINALMSLEFLSLAWLLAAAIKISLQSPHPNETIKASMEGRRNSYEARQQ